MKVFHTPATVAPPAGHHSHAVEVPDGSRFLHIAGQPGMRPDGGLAQTFAGQADACWNNIASILAAADMDAADLIRTTTYLVNADDLAAAAAAQVAFLGAARPASTTLVVSRLADPSWAIQIEAVAAARV